jgi:predicted DNA-binding transcriptional regulator YafY
MRHTKNETSTQTLTRLIKAADRQHPITLAYLKEEKDENGKRTGQLVETVRTVEIYDFTVTAAGDVLIKAMDRETGKSRSWRLDRIVSYTIHRTSYQIKRAATGDKPTHPTYELAATISPRAAGISTATRMNNLAAAFAA